MIAEWINVSNQWDQEVDWFQSHEHFLREGYAWVGVSAQRAGLHSATGLKLWSPTRYGALDVTAANTINDDSLSYDIFSPGRQGDPQPGRPGPARPAGRAGLRDRHRPLAVRGTPAHVRELDPAAVEHPRRDGPARRRRRDAHRHADADLPHQLRGRHQPAASATAPAPPDSPTFRNWEVAGASHGDWKLITDYGPLRKRDIGTYPGGYPGEPQTCTLPSLSRVPQHMVQNALYDHTFNWVAYGIAPPSAPVISTATPDGRRDRP